MVQIELDLFWLSTEENRNIRTAFVRKDELFGLYSSLQAEAESSGLGSAFK
jgi:hypothetical protein